MAVFPDDIEFIESGDGPTVLFLPGSFGTGAGWKPIINELGDRFRFVTTSLLGYGATTERRDNNENTTHTLTDFQSAKVSYEEMIEDEEFMNQIKKRFFFVTKNIDGEIYNMEAHYEEKGTPPRNWKAALKKWLSRLEKFKREDERKELAKANLES